MVFDGCDWWRDKVVGCDMNSWGCDGVGFLFDVRCGDEFDVNAMIKWCIPTCVS